MQNNGLDPCRQSKTYSYIWMNREAEEDAFKGRGSEVVAKQKLGHSLGEHRSRERARGFLQVTAGSLQRAAGVADKPTRGGSVRLDLYIRLTTSVAEASHIYIVTCREGSREFRRRAASCSISPASFCGSELSCQRYVCSLLYTSFRGSELSCQGYTRLAAAGRLLLRSTSSGLCGGAGRACPACLWGRRRCPLRTNSFLRLGYRRCPRQVRHVDI